MESRGIRKVDIAETVIMARQWNTISFSLGILIVLSVLAVKLNPTDATYNIGTISHEGFSSCSVKLLSRHRRQVVNDSSTPSTPSGATLGPEIVQNDHKYYTSRVLMDNDRGRSWVDLDQMERGKKQTHGTLSNSHKTAATQKLSFVFPFYGHEVTQVTIATGGFLYMSPFLHQWLTATQYIAPLMANFDLSIGNQSNIHFIDNTTHFAVHWEKVFLKDDQKAGAFDFQAVLVNDGSIIFGYKRVPKHVDLLLESNHPVKVGLSDAYYIDTTTTGNLKRRTIFEYHRVEIQKRFITQDVAVQILPLPTCISLRDCNQCLTKQLSFNCRWCGSTSRCSDGLDRHRQDWLKNRCHQKEQRDASECGSGVNAGLIIGVLLVVILIGAIVGWVLYAYFNPTSRSGIWLIEHRPSELKKKMQNMKSNLFNRGDNSADKYAVGSGGTESTA